MSTETWYVLEDGTVADPHEVTQNKDGSLQHPRGKVAMRNPTTPSSRSVNADEERKKNLQAQKPELDRTTREMKPAASPARADYKTR